MQTQPTAYQALDESIEVDSNQNKVQVPVQQILFISSERNYVRIEMAEGPAIQLRNTIKNMEALLLDYPHIVRCHRAFIVNIRQVDQVEGNAQGYRLHLKGYTGIVPVSRRYIKTLQRLLN